MKRNFPSFIEAFLAYSENVGAPKKFLLWSAIAGISAALERKTWIVYNGIQVIYPNTYIMLIADSGIAKKSTAGRAMTELLYEVEDLSFMSTQLSAASLVKQLESAGNRKTFEYEGVNYKNSSIFAYSSEAKVTLGDQKGLSGVQELLTDFYDCGEPNIWSTKKGWNKQTLSGGDVTIYNPCLNLLACSTPAWLMEALGKSGIAGGFASRILFITQKERAASNLGWVDDDEPSQISRPSDTKTKLIEDLTQISKIAGRFRPTVGWKDCYNQILRDTERQIDAHAKTDLAAYYSRKMWHCMKLAQILAADQRNDLIVTPDHLLAAKELLETIEPDMYSAFSLQGENKSLASFVNVWEIMRRKKVWRKQDLVSKVYRHATPNQLNEHLIMLTNMKKIRLLNDIGFVSYQVDDPAPLD